MITPSAGTPTAGACHGKKSVRAFAERRWKSNGGWMARTGCAFGVAISPCAPARNQRHARQVLPAYGLQALPRTEHANHRSRLLLIIHGGHFNMAENRTFLLCIDSAASVARRLDGSPNYANFCRT